MRYLGFSLAWSKVATWTHAEFQWCRCFSSWKSHNLTCWDIFEGCVSEIWLDSLDTNISSTSPSNDFSNPLIKLLLCLQMKEHMDKTYFRFWAAIGELIWPMVTTQLSQFSSFLESIYDYAVQGVFRYLFSTMRVALMLTWHVKLECAEKIEVPPGHSRTHDQSGDHNTPLSAMIKIIGYSDNDCVMNIHHIRSTTGLVFLLRIATLAWKNRVKHTGSLSTILAAWGFSTEDCCSGLKKQGKTHMIP